MDRNKIRIATIDCIIGVALRKESVDRNSFYSQQWHLTKQSLSARRAWIEITSNREKRKYLEVALRKESVDRNIGGSNGTVDIISRSPQGERG